MTDLENTIKAHQKTLSNSDLFHQDPETYQKSADALQAAESALGQLEERWLELEMKREDAEGI